MNHRALMATAQRMPEAREMLRFFDETGRFWRDYLRLDIDLEDFAARYLRAWSRGSVEHITLDEITLAAIVEASAHLTLTHPQLQTLRTDIREANAKLIARVKSREETLAP